MNSPRILLAFTETKVFTRQIETEASFDVLTAIQDDLLEDPERHAVIGGTKGARKGRIADPNENRGKSGSYRYMYLYLEHKERIYLLYLFSKKAQSNLSKAQKEQVAKLVQAIKKEVN